uniref:gamma-butyrobetaine hydroxylase-like domain-containing protein n=1 Tax=Polynucleobacter sp. TaxID=2029855 RepID=UPI004048D212
MMSSTEKAPLPKNIIVHQQSKVLELAYENKTYQLPFEFLRVWSPSAEVRGHGVGQETLQTGKRDVLIGKIEQIGHYAIKPVFSDGHESGIFSWDYLYEMCINQEEMWQDYLDRVELAGVSRDAPMIKDDGHSCGH